MSLFPNGCTYLINMLSVVLKFIYFSLFHYLFHWNAMKHLIYTTPLTALQSVAKQFTLKYNSFHVLSYIL